MAEVQIDAARRDVVLSLEKERHALDDVRLAAYEMTGRAWVRLEDGGACWRLALRSREPASEAGLRALAEAFEAELGERELRSRLEERSGAQDDALVRRALAGGAEPAALTPEQDAEIARLVAEAEAEARERREKGESADPLGIRRTWEERGRGGG